MRPDAAALVESYCAVPYQAHGDTLAGWDCRGCVRHARAELFGLESPGMGREFYSTLDVRDLDAVESMMAARMALWRPLAVFDDEPADHRARTVGRLPGGAVLLFRVFKRDAHVGLLLNRRDFLHTMAGQQTTVARLTDWAGRIRGAYDTDREPPGAA